MLQEAVGLDANYAPAWSALCQRYYDDSRYAGSGELMLERSAGAAQRALKLDPSNISAAGFLIAHNVERGWLGMAYREAQDLTQRRPDNATAHFFLGYVLRYAGLLQEAADECATARSLDPHNRMLRSCSGVFLLRGEYQRSLEFLSLDKGSEWYWPHLLETLLREGKKRNAVLIRKTSIAQWQSYNMLLACTDNSSPAEAAALAKTVQPVDDPEVNYYFASHLAYCGETNSALAMLRKAIQGSYCSYPAIDTDPFFRAARTKLEFAEIRSAAIACQKRFLEERNSVH